MTEKLEWIACVFHIAESEYDYIEDLLTEYDIGKYLIGFEKEPYHHYHIAFQGTAKMYNAFCKRLVEKYDLRGKAGNGKARQYGRIKKIEDIDRLLIYSCKDGNVRGNFEKEEIEKFIEKSFKKDDKLNWLKEVREWVEKQDIQPRKKDCDGREYYCYTVVRLKVIEYYRKKDIVFNQNNIKACLNEIFQRSKTILGMSIEELDKYYFY